MWAWQQQQQHNDGGGADVTGGGGSDSGGSANSSDGSSSDRGSRSASWGLLPRLDQAGERPPRSSLSPTASDADHAPLAAAAWTLLSALEELVASLLGGGGGGGGSGAWNSGSKGGTGTKIAVSGSPSPRPTRVYRRPQPRARGPIAPPLPSWTPDSAQLISPPPVPAFATGATRTSVSPQVVVDHPLVPVMLHPPPPPLLPPSPALRPPFPASTFVGPGDGGGSDSMETDVPSPPAPWLSSSSSSALKRKREFGVADLAGPRPKAQHVSAMLSRRLSRSLTMGGGESGGGSMARWDSENNDDDTAGGRIGDNNETGVPATAGWGAAARSINRDDSMGESGSGGGGGSGSGIGAGVDDSVGNSGQARIQELECNIALLRDGIARDSYDDLKAITERIVETARGLGGGDLDALSYVSPAWSSAEATLDKSLKFIAVIEDMKATASSRWDVADGGGTFALMERMRGFYAEKADAYRDVLVDSGRAWLAQGLPVEREVVVATTAWLHSTVWTLLSALLADLQRESRFSTLTDDQLFESTLSGLILAADFSSLSPRGFLQARGAPDALRLARALLSHISSSLAALEAGQGGAAAGAVAADAAPTATRPRGLGDARLALLASRACRVLEALAVLLSGPTAATADALGSAGDDDDAEDGVDDGLNGGGGGGWNGGWNGGWGSGASYQRPSVYARLPRRSGGGASGATVAVPFGRLPSHVAVALFVAPGLDTTEVEALALSAVELRLSLFA
ncbi:hypothetical protein HK405_000473 [Cladochytrium tenue]|nr:hypothetical protein HK405_000473 [Cladochytrium tenue]